MRNTNLIMTQFTHTLNDMHFHFFSNQLNKWNFQKENTSDIPLQSTGKTTLRVWGVYSLSELNSLYHNALSEFRPKFCIPNGWKRRAEKMYSNKSYFMWQGVSHFSVYNVTQMDFNDFWQSLFFVFEKEIRKKVFSPNYKYASYREIYYRQNIALEGLSLFFAFKWNSICRLKFVTKSIELIFFPVYT